MVSEVFTKIRDAVLGLGTTPDEIAENLRLEGVQGLMGVSSSCAISAYVRKHWPDVLPSTSPYGLVLDATCSRYVPLPPSHSEFVISFDRGEYPELISPHPWNALRLEGKPV